MLAANLGLYNGFLAAGLIWSLISQNKDIAVFFLSCVIIAGIYGGYSTKKEQNIHNSISSCFNWYSLFEFLNCNPIEK